jgi:2-polyprenyl-3-methyl-5-hydroxy-6-metoxy-1,4-benzoquinol methylase
VPRRVPFKGAGAFRLDFSLLKPFFERAIWGGERRERLLLALLGRHYESVFRRQWLLPVDKPHHFDHRIGSFLFATGVSHGYGYYRGYFAAEMIRDGDVLLDVACGDGFFARRFFAPKCKHVDAIDVDRNAIAHASRFNDAPNIRYALLDAAKEPFPRERYNVIVLDGALGHFPPEGGEHLLTRIRQALPEDGVFVGSEELGTVGHDHLQYFETLVDLARIMRGHFELVYLRSIDYPLPSGDTRREAFWRCATRPDRLEKASWHDFSLTPASTASAEAPIS